MYTHVLGHSSALAGLPPLLFFAAWPVFVYLYICVCACIHMCGVIQARLQGCHFFFSLLFGLYMYMCICVSMNVFVDWSVYVYLYIYIYVYASHVFTCRILCASLKRTHTCTNTYACINTHTCINSDTCTNIHTCIYMYKYIHAYITHTFIYT